jgi:hypothetical protein
MYKYFTIYICQTVKYAVHVFQELWLPKYHRGLLPKLVRAVKPIVHLVGYELVCTLCSLCLFPMRINKNFKKWPELCNKIKSCGFT